MTNALIKSSWTVRLNIYAMLPARGNEAVAGHNYVKDQGLVAVEDPSYLCLTHLQLDVYTV